MLFYPRVLTFDWKHILDDYFGKQWVEPLFKTSKRYLKLLLISK